LQHNPVSDGAFVVPSECAGLKASTWVDLNATFFACLPKHALRKVEPLLRFGQILLETLYISLKGF